MLVIITFYAGELVWRERDNRLDQIQRRAADPDLAAASSPSCVALMLVPVAAAGGADAVRHGDPDGQGLHHFELGLYLSDLFGIELVNYWLVCVLAIAVHSLVNQKYLGHFVMIVYFIAAAVREPARLRAQPLQVRQHAGCTSTPT